MVPYGKDLGSDTRQVPVLIFKFSYVKPQLLQALNCVNVSDASYCYSQYIIFPADHHSHCYPCSCSSEKSTSELDSFTSADEKRPKRSMKHGWKNMPKIHVSYPYCSMYKDKNECYKQNSNNGGEDSWPHEW
jgi:hypothetical protein